MVSCVEEVALLVVSCVEEVALLVVRCAEEVATPCGELCELCRGGRYSLW